jgi:hypothetical protein
MIPSCVDFKGMKIDLPFHPSRYLSTVILLYDIQTFLDFSLKDSQTYCILNSIPPSLFSLKVSLFTKYRNFKDKLYHS